MTTHTAPTATEMNAHLALRGTEAIREILAESPYEPVVYGIGPDNPASPHARVHTAATAAQLATLGGHPLCRYAGLL